MYREIGAITQGGSTLLRAWHITVPAGARSLRRHSHIQFEISVVRSGSGQYTLATGKEPMEPGDVFVFSGNEQHCITSVGADGLALTNLQFEPRYLLDNPEESITGKYVSFCFFHGESFRNRIPAACSAALRQHIHAICGELATRRLEYRLMVRSRLNELLVQLIREHGYSDRRPVVSGKGAQQVRAAIEYIDTHLYEDISLTDIAAAVGMSPNYFSALFRQVSGVTLWGYITDKRIGAAIQLLTDKRCTASMLEIATRCGFNNTANFNKAFRKATGATPSEYRKLYDLPL